MKKLLVLSLIMVFFLTGCSCSKQVDTTPPKNNELQDKQSPDNQDVKPKDEEKIAEDNPQLPGVVLVMVDNFSKACPQSGLDKADIVYEMLAEAGITRYMAAFYHQKADKIGPIRSARPYYIELAKGIKAPLAHAGGSTTALSLIQKLDIDDLDEIYNSGKYFWRDKNRGKPHNLYTSTDLLIQGAKAKGYKISDEGLLPVGSEWEGTNYPEDIKISYSFGKYRNEVAWHYTGEVYERKVNGQANVMKDKTKITTDNVIVIKAKTKVVVKKDTPYSDIEVVGKGDAYYFVDGKMKEGFWEKASVSSALKFYDDKKEIVKFKSGKTWVQVIPDSNELSF